MSDSFTPEQRSSIMRAVKASGNRSTEIKLINIFRLRGLKGWRRQYKAIGHPDFVFLKDKIAIFTDGCFWHGHGCRKFPATRQDYWTKKIARNKERDIAITSRYEARGWLVIRIWECELMHKNENLLLEKLRPLIELKN